MMLSPEDRAIVADMEQREIHLKKRREAESLIAFRSRRFVALLLLLGAVVGVLISFGVIGLLSVLVDDRARWWVFVLTNAVFAAFLGVEVARHILETKLGKRWIARNERRLRQRHSGALHAGRRWLEFYYERQNIGPYVPQILRFLKEGRFESVADAVAFAHEARLENAMVDARALQRFDAVARSTNALVLSSTGEDGRPSSRVMRFVTTERPGVWLITTAPYAPKVPELERGQVAIETVPSPDGSTISSNRVWIGPSAMTFTQVAPLYEEQVPGYDDGMTEAEREVELVYELVLYSAKIDSWVEHDVVEFGQPGR